MIAQTTTTRGRLAAGLRAQARKLEGGRLILVRLDPEADLDRRELRLLADRIADYADREVDRMVHHRATLARVRLKTRGNP